MYTLLVNKCVHMCHYEIIYIRNNNLVLQKVEHEMHTRVEQL